MEGAPCEDPQPLPQTLQGRLKDVSKKLKIAQIKRRRSGEDPKVTPGICCSVLTAVQLDAKIERLTAEQNELQASVDAVRDSPRCTDSHGSDVHTGARGTIIASHIARCDTYRGVLS